MNVRRGYSLVELIAVMSVGTVILGLSVETIHRAMQFGSQAEGRRTVHQVTLQLSENFRRDVHQAEEVKFLEEADSPKTMQLAVPAQRSIVYQILGNRLLRQQQVDGQQHTEVYDFPNGYTISLQETSPGAVELLITSKAPAESIPSKTVLHLSPELGRLLRLTRAEEATP